MTMVKSSKAARMKAILLGVAVLSPLIIARAAGPDNSSVRPKMADVENGTLVVGRWMIFLPKLTPSGLEEAKKSAKEVDPAFPEESQTEQNDVFYKSDVVTSAEVAASSEAEILKGGTWYRINSVNKIEDISSKGDPVTNNYMDQIYLMFYLKPDGKIYDLKTGETVDIYSLEDPYDLEALPELENLRNQRATWQSDEGVKKAREKEIASLGRVLAKVKKTDEMEKADKNVKALAKVRQYLIEQNALREEVEELDKIYSATSNERKLLILKVVDERVDSELRYAMAPSDSKKDEDKEDTGSNTSYPDLKEAYQTAKDKIHASGGGNNSKSDEDSEGDVKATVSDGPNVISQTTEQRRTDVIQKAISSDNAGARESIKDLVHLKNISSDSIVNKQGEIKVIDEMQKVTLEKYSAALKAGESVEYKQDKASGENPRALESSKAEYMKQVEQLSADIDLLAGAKVLRLESDEERVVYLNSIIAATAVAKSGIVADDFAENFAASEEDLENQLTDLQMQAQTRLNGGPEGDKLKRDSKMLQIEYKKALDANDLAKAARVELKRDALLNNAEGEDKTAVGSIVKNKKETEALKKTVAEGQKASAQLLGLKAREEELRLDLPEGVLKTLDDPNGKNNIADLLKLDAGLLSASGGGGKLSPDVLKALNDPNGKGKITDLLKVEEEIKIEEAKVLEGQKAGEKLTVLKLNEKMLQSGMDSGTLDTLNDVNEKVDEAKDLIKDATVGSNVTRVDKIVDEISKSSPMVGAIVANAALKEIEDELVKKVANGDSVPTALNDAYDKIKGMLDGGLNTAVENMQTESEIEQSVNDVLGNSKLSEDEKQALMILLFDELGKQDGSAIYANLKNQQLMEALKSKNILIIDKINQPNTDLYVPLRNLAEYKKYSYVWEQDCKSASLTKGKSVYKFKDDSNIAEFADISKSGKEKEVAYERETMTEKAASNSVMYVPQDYVLETFEVDAEEISDSKYAVMYGSNLETIFESLKKRLSEKK
ncbi:hypothetical protein FACS189481_1570 [Clostridia bacterium]|nr:hypothetical protein FACS189481_1570 [Clostridia bacterium]